VPNKSYDPSGATALVTFSLPAEVGAETAVLCGDFNDWDPSVHPMDRASDGSFSVAVELDAGQSYAYRFLLDGDRWENDWEAERYQANGYGSDDGVVEV
jgi:1,4-alpha-glucan branching enzyme